MTTNNITTQPNDNYATHQADQILARSQNARASIRPSTIQAVQPALEDDLR
jgi:hypothetical protein